VDYLVPTKLFDLQQHFLACRDNTSSSVGALLDYGRTRWQHNIPQNIFKPTEHW
jgi:hypothetical protein